MGWPVPPMTIASRPERPRVWLWALAGVFTIAAAAAISLFCWGEIARPPGRLFWLCNVIVPVASAVVLLGTRWAWYEGQLGRWQALFEQREACLAEWHHWSRGSLPVLAVTTLTPDGIRPLHWLHPASGLPLNNARAPMFDNIVGNHGERNATLVHELIRRVTPELLRLPASSRVDVTLMLGYTNVDDPVRATRALRDAWSGMGTASQLGDVTACTSLVLAEAVGEWIDLPLVNPRLLLVLQCVPPGTADVPFGEVCAAMLFDAASQDGSHQPPYPARLFRPMTSSHADLETDLPHLCTIQLCGILPNRIWLTRLAGASGRSTVTSLFGAAGKLGADHVWQQTLVDDVLGLPGPLTGWIAAAHALEVARADSSAHMLADGIGPDHEAVTLVLAMGAKPAKATE